MKKEEIKEAEIISEKVIDKPEIVVPEAQIKGTAEITNNIKDVKESAVALKDYYSKLIITEDNLNVAKSEKANVNIFKEKVADYRKSIIAEYKKPIDEFESLAKETESILKETYEIINTQCDKYDQAKKEELIEEGKRYLKELCVSKNIVIEIPFEMTGVKVNLSTSLKKIREGIDVFVENIQKDLITIETLENKDEILVEYQKDLNLARSIKDVSDRHEAMKVIQEQKIEKTEEVSVDNGPEILQAPLEAPKVVSEEGENTTKESELKAATFRVVATMEQLKKLVEFMRTEGINYESVK